MTLAGVAFSFVDSVRTFRRGFNAFRHSSPPFDLSRAHAKNVVLNHSQIAKSERLESEFLGMTLTPPWAGDESARSQTQRLLDEKPWHESNGVRANSSQIARSGPRKCAERNAHEKGRDALPLTFVSSWSTKLAAGFNDVSRTNTAAINDRCRKCCRKLQRCPPQVCRTRQRPPPQETPQRSTIGPTTVR